MLDRDEVLKDAQNKIDLAYLTTPLEYHGFITLIAQNKRLNPEERNREAIYVRVETPYIRVDGRVRMAQDEHFKLGKALEIRTAFEMAFDIPTCRATVKSEVHGACTGTAKVNIGGAGVDKTSPLENAETSAIGRALGFMGYGLLGGGIASAEEVEQAIEEQAPATKSTKVAEADPYDFGPGEREFERAPDRVAEAPSDRQMQFLRGLLSSCGTLKGDSLPVIHAVYEHEPLSKARVSADIEELDQSDMLPPRYLGAYLKILRERAKLSQKDVYEYIMKYFNTVKIKDLSRSQQDQLIAWMAVGQEHGEAWVEMVKNTATRSRVDTQTVSDWAEHVFPDMAEEDIVKRVAEISDKDLRMDIRTYQRTMEQQLEMEGAS